MASSERGHYTVLVGEDWEHGGFGLYIHWPFCQAKCPYCDFNSHVVKRIDHEAWERAYVLEIERVAQKTQGRVLSSIYFGGGTPSLMEARTIERLIAAAHKAWRFSNEIEITLEANPTSIEAEKFSQYRLAGVNRVSIGLQALNNDDLKRLGRLHSVAESLKALETAQRTFERVSFDLIYARQDQTEEAWRKELERALSFGTDHLSLYQLTIENGTAFGDRYAAGKLSGLPSDDRACNLFNMTHELCAQQGLQHYEVSNYARAGFESQHNLLYWRYGDYAGIGPGAHGRLSLDGQRYATQTTLAPAMWLAQAEASDLQTEQRVVLSLQDQALEFLLMGLRVHDGVSLMRLSELCPDFKLQNAKTLIDDGFLKQDGDQLFVSEQGRPLLNTILYQLTA